MNNSAKLRLIGGLLLGAAVVASALLISNDETRRQVVEFLVRIKAWGPWGALVAGLLYLPACVLALPGSLLTLGLGFAFGPVWGTVAASLGSTAGATAAFLIARTIGRRFIEQRVADSPRFRALDEAVGQQGMKIVLLTRLSPVFPFNVLNYTYGLTKVRTFDYVLASWIGMFPGTLLYVYLGSAIQNLSDLAAGRVEPSVWQTVGYVTGLVATFVVTILLTRIARRALSAAGALADDSDQAATDSAA